MSDHHPRTLKDNPRLDPGHTSLAVKGGLTIGALGLGASVTGLFMGGETKTQFFFSYLTAFGFFTTIALGGLFFVILHHLVRASWSTSIRRMAENLAANLPWMALFFIPIVLGLGELYHWSHADAVAADPVLKGKSGYLNVPFFIGRAVLFFAIWSGLALFFRRTSMQQDVTGEVALTFKMRRMAPGATLLFALTITFAAFDWLMSVDPHWFSTIFGVITFAGALVSMYATLALTMLWLTKKGALTNTLTVDNFHDVGKMMFGFIVFWTYTSFSQYFLIWYGNIPEETAWYVQRQSNGCMPVFMTLVLGHFLVPFWFLMSRHAKRNRKALAAGAAWMLLMHYVDIYFYVMPVLHHHRHFHWLDLTTLLGIGGFFVALYVRRFGTAPLVPVKDPQLIAAMEYENAT